jgi:hypothetical protein
MSDTNRRARLRGRGAIAQWRIFGAVWAGRMFAVVVAIGALSSLLSKNPDAWIGGAVILILAGVVLVATWRVSRGSRPAVVALFLLYLLAKLSSWKLGGELLWAGALWSVLLIGAFGNGIWGTFELAAIARESEALASRDAVSDGAALPSST